MSPLPSGPGHRGAAGDDLEQIRIKDDPGPGLSGQTGQGDTHHIDIPPAVVGLISGGIRDREHLEVAQAMRASCQVVIALGTCATHGGIPSMINGLNNEELLERYYRGCETTDPHADPGDPALPPLLDRTYALDEKIKVDLYLPGCPPHPDQIGEAIIALLEGRAPNLPTKSVCDTCPTVREGKGKVKKVRRFIQNAHFEPGRPLSEMHCLLEQGYLCMGPVTRAGCAGAQGEAPRCLVARVPCRGCFGPVQHDGNQLLDMLNALASNGIDCNSVTDFASCCGFPEGTAWCGLKRKRRVVNRSTWQGGRPRPPFSG